MLSVLSFHCQFSNRISIGPFHVECKIYLSSYFWFHKGENRNCSFQWDKVQENNSFPSSLYIQQSSPKDFRLNKASQLTTGIILKHMANISVIDLSYMSYLTIYIYCHLLPVPSLGSYTLFQIFNSSVMKSSRLKAK